MNDRNFMKMLEAQWAKGNFVCIGLDSEPDKIPESVIKEMINYCGNNTHHINDYVNTRGIIIEFNSAIVETTKDIVCAYKLNSAFYEAHGDEGIGALEQTIRNIHSIAPDIPVILDAKRADVGNTNTKYAKFAFDYLKTDAITVHPYLGAEALQPFLERADKGVIVLCRTSNPGAGEFQDLEVRKHNHISHLYSEDDRWEPMYLHVARRVASEWNKNDNCALVVGATYPDELREVREIVGDIPILIPGIGAQGGDVKKTVSAGKDSRGQGMIINSSRGIIFASNDEDFAQAARRETEKLHNLINNYVWCHRKEKS